MEMLSHSGACIILSNRYALLECLAVSGAGKIYRGRDLEQVREQGLESRILIHVLPTMTPVLPLDAMFQQISETCQRIAEPWILAPQAYGQDGELAYFVLESPDKWGLHSLSSQAGHVFQETMQRLNPLVKQKYLERQTDPALLLYVSSQEVYLLATALSPVIQMLQNRETRPRIMPRKPLRAAMVGSLMALFTLFTAVAGNAIMDMGTVEPSVPLLAQAPKPAGKLLLASLPQTEVTPVPPANRDSGGQEVLDDSVSMVAEKPLLPVTTASLPQVRPTVPVSRQEPHSEPTRDAIVLLETEVAVNQPAQPASIEGIIQQAYAAMTAGHLGGNGSGALHFTRQLREQSPQHPQVARLGQEITADYLRQVRVALQADDIAAAAALLPTTRQLIAEFDLPNLSPAQQVLEEKTAQLSSYE